MGDDERITEMAEALIAASAGGDYNTPTGLSDEEWVHVGFDLARRIRGERDDRIHYEKGAQTAAKRAQQFRDRADYLERKVDRLHMAIDVLIERAGEHMRELDQFNKGEGL